MISYVWFILISLGIVYALLTGNIGIINDEIMNSGKSSLDLIFNIAPLLILWSGILNIAENSGLLNKFSNLIKPILKRLFPSLSDGDKSLDYIASNIAANMLGLGSAATPFGLKAMEELQKNNKNKDTATPAMITFLILNTGGVTIIPTSVIALRHFYNSSNPTEIIITSIIATTVSSVSGLLLDYFIRRKKRV